MRTKFLEATSHKPQATSHKPQATSHKPQATSHKPQATSLLLVAFLAIMFSQQKAFSQACGFKPNADFIQRAKNLQLLPPNLNPAAPDRIKIKFWILCSGIGSSTAAISIANLKSALTVLNAVMPAQSIQFDQCNLTSDYDAFGYIYNQSNVNGQDYFNAFPVENETAERAISTTTATYNYYSKGCINVYVTKRLKIDPINGGGYANGYVRPNLYPDKIFLAVEVPGDANHNLQNGIVLSHEIGHLFGLFHTNGVFFNANNQPMPDCSTEELVNGSNGNTHGDLVPDTNADPNCISNSYFDRTTCQYPKAAILSNPCGNSFCDINGQTYQPTPNNIMFTYPVCGVVPNPFNTFTAGQKLRMVSHYNTHLKNKVLDIVNPTISKIFLRDNSRDIGLEPNSSASLGGGLYDIWESPDIWNRNNNDNIGVHQKVDYTGGTQEYLKVRIRHPFCYPSPLYADIKLRAYWTMGSTGENWPDAWNATTAKLCNLQAGGEMPYTVVSGSGSLFGLPAQGAEVYTFEYSPPNPSSYSCMNLSLFEGTPMICFLARIDAPVVDPMGTTETTGPIQANILNSNNIATRNTALVDLPGVVSPTGGGGTVLTYNGLSSPALYDLNIQNTYTNADQAFTQNGRIILTLDDQLWNSWMESGAEASGAEIYDAVKHKIRITDPQNAIIYQVKIPAKTHQMIGLNFYVETAISNSREYKYTVSQFLAGTTQTAGSSCVYHVRINAPSSQGIGIAPTNQTASTQHSSTEEVISDEDSPTIFWGYPSKLECAIQPNPFQEHTTIQLGIPQDEALSVELWDMTGKKVQDILSHQFLTKGRYTLSLDTPTLTAGVYILRIITAQDNLTQKITILK